MRARLAELSHSLFNASKLEITMHGWCAGGSRSGEFAWRVNDDCVSVLERDTLTEIVGADPTRRQQALEALVATAERKRGDWAEEDCELTWVGGLITVTDAGRFVEDLEFEAPLDAADDTGRPRGQAVEAAQQGGAPPVPPVAGGVQLRLPFGLPA